MTLNLKMCFMAETVWQFFFINYMLFKDVLFIAGFLNRKALLKLHSTEHPSHIFLRAVYVICI